MLRQIRSYIKNNNIFLNIIELHLLMKILSLIFHLNNFNKTNILLIFNNCVNLMTVNPKL